MATDCTLFTRLGGIRAMAALVDEAPSTVQSWKNAGRIPAQKQPIVLDRAKAAGFDITAHDVVFPMGDDVDHGADDTDPSAGTSTGQNDEMSRQAAQA